MLTIRNWIASGSTISLILALLAACGNGESTQYTIGGSVSGLTGQGLVLQNTGNTSIPISANGTFTFSGKVNDGAAYSVTVGTQPSPSQICSVANGTGTVASANVTNINVTCVNAYSLGGTVSGLVGTGLVLMNGGTALTVSANGTFAFANAIASGSAYAITVSSQPKGPTEICTVAHGSGVIGSADVKNVTVGCRVSTARFTYLSSQAGIYCFSIDAQSDVLTPSANAPCVNGLLTGFATEPRGKFGYATAPSFNLIVPFSIDPVSGALTRLTGTEIASGTEPLLLRVDSSGRFLYSANYASGDVSGYSLDPTSGHLTAVPGSPFSVGQGPTPVAIKGSNQVAIDATSRFLYVASQNFGISAFTIDANTGTLTPVAGSPYTSTQATGIAIDPATRFVFATTVSGESVAVFSIDAGTGALTAVPGSPFNIRAMGKDVVVDLTGSFVYAASGDHISGFAIDPTSGTLTPLAGSPFPCPGMPYALSITPHLGYLVAGNDDHTVQTFSIDPLTGALAQIGGSPATATNSLGLFSISFSP
jgi:6-phosphogluconolactonase